MSGYISDKNLVIEFCEEYQDLFASWLDVIHDIDPQEAGVIIENVKQGKQDDQ